MKSWKIRSFFRDLKSAGRSSCIALALCGVLNLFFLPFIHFHSDNIHTHPGEIGSHEHKGHFHSHELDTIAHWANIVSEDPQSDGPLHHTHSPSDYDGDQVEYTTLALHTVDTDKIFSKTNLEVSRYSFPESYQDTRLVVHPVLTPTANWRNPARQVRGPPSA